MAKKMAVIREVGIDDVRLASVQAFFHLLRRLLGIVARPVRVLLRWKIGFNDQFEHQHRCCHVSTVRDPDGVRAGIDRVA